MGNKQVTRRASVPNTATAASSFVAQNTFNQHIRRQISVEQNRVNRRASEFRTRTQVDPDDKSNGVDPVLRPNRRRSSTAAVALTSKGSYSMLKPKRLTPRQCQLVIKSWNKKVPKNRMAKEAFTLIFTEAEGLKTAFGLDESLRGKKLRSDPRFSSHTELFTDTFDFTIKHLDDLTLITENAEQLGRRHAALQIPNFRPEYWTLFTETIIEQASNTEDKETQLAWRQLVLTIVFYMKLGFDRECLKMARSSASRSPRPI